MKKNYPDSVWSICVYLLIFLLRPKFHYPLCLLNPKIIIFKIIMIIQTFTPSFKSMPAQNIGPFAEKTIARHFDWSAK